MKYIPYLHTHRITTVAAVMCACISIQSVVANQASDHVTPEYTYASVQNDLIEAKNYMVATAHPLATKAGYEVLKKGGNAIDAMVTVQTMLGLVEPQSSGLGGGAFLIYYDAKNKRLTTYDGRETAPLAATKELFLDSDGKPLGFFEAVVGGRSVGTPGTVKLLADTHKERGELPWHKLLQPAITVAKNGFSVSPRMASSISRDAERLKRIPASKAYFFTSEDKPLPVGYKLKNAAYAETLSTLSEHGGDYFYTPEFAKQIVDAVQEAPFNPGKLTIEDFLNYKVIERAPLCSEYREFEICGMGPPSSGAYAVGQILGILNHLELKSVAPKPAKFWHLFVEAERLSFADRGLYIADSDFIAIPKGLLSPSYLKQRASLIQADKALSEVLPGNPNPKQNVSYIPGHSYEQPSTSHFVIVDGHGNIASMTTTIENGFGSRLMAGGFLLNNELTDFSFNHSKGDELVANRVEPGKRPRSSMAPTIVLKNSRPYLALGSPGGSRIINYVAKTLVAHIDLGLDIQKAINLPHISKRFGTLEIEESANAEDLKSQFEAMGHSVKIKNLNSGIHAIQILDNKLLGAADPRREGTVLGD